MVAIVGWDANRPQSRGALGARWMMIDVSVRATW